MMRIAILSLLLGLTSPAVAQTTVPTLPEVPTTGPDIVVQHRTDAELAQFIKTLTDTSHGTQVARWNTEICARAVNFDETHAAMIEDRIGVIARALKIGVEPKRCRPTIVILATTNANAFAKAFYDRFPTLLHDPDYGLAHGAAVDEFLASRPVRWIDATRTGNAQGAPIVNANMTYGGGSHIQQSTRENVVGSIVIVDMLQMSHIDWGQLADYVAFVLLARPVLNATPPDSVMGIFVSRDAGTRGPAGLTANDQAFLHGLYRSDDALNAVMQRSQIADQIKKAKRP